MLVTFFIGFPSLFFILLSISGDPIYEYESGDYILVIFFFISIFMFALLFSKQGIYFKDGKLNYAQFIFGKPFLWKKINLTDITDVSILTANGSQKLAFVLGGNPDLAVSTELNKVCLLNKDHTTKLFLLTTRRRDYAEKIIKELMKELKLEFNLYSPPTSKRRW